MIDAVRKREAGKRGGKDLAVTLDEALQSEPLKSAELLELHEALDLSSATVKRDWRIARAWLAHAIGAN